jgi:hypothetical protein
MGRKSILATLASVLLFGSAALTQPAGDRQANQLTADEKAAGWILLFDGKTWTNWTLSRVRKSSWWKIEKGWIRSVPRGKSGDMRRLATLESFRNFELQFEWRIAKEGNSGVKYRIQQVWRFRPEDMDTGKPLLLPPTLESLQAGTAMGFEYQLTDDENAPDALDSPSRSSAALYRIVAPRKPRPVVAGTLHSTLIKVSGDRFEHWLDGERVAEGGLRSDALRAVLEKNRAAGLRKFETATAKEEQQRYDGLLERLTAEALLGLHADESPIDFQHHRSAVWFRNIKIRRLQN